MSDIPNLVTLPSGVVQLKCPLFRLPKSILPDQYALAHASIFATSHHVPGMRKDSNTGTPLDSTVTLFPQERLNVMLRRSDKQGDRETRNSTETRDGD